jgi:hypothetical protein
MARSGLKINHSQIASGYNTTQKTAYKTAKTGRLCLRRRTWLLRPILSYNCTSKRRTVRCNATTWMHFALINIFSTETDYRTRHMASLPRDTTCGTLLKLVTSVVIGSASLAPLIALAAAGCAESAKTDSQITSAIRADTFC